MIGYPKRIYLSASWKGDHRASTAQIANLIASHGVTVVRDHESNKHDPLREKRTWVKRVETMLMDCSGLVVVLPHNSTNVQTTSPFLIPELLAADKQGIPILLFANSGVVISLVPNQNTIECHFPNVGIGNVLSASDIFPVPVDEQAQLDSILTGAGGFALSDTRLLSGPFKYPNYDHDRATKAVIEEFVAECPPRQMYSFVFNILPFALKDSAHQTIAKEVFKATGMACHISLDAITGEQSVRRNWELMLQRSDLVIAELSSLRDSCLFEVGCAIGWNKSVYVLSKKGQQSLPFGLDDHSFYQYRSVAELETYVRDTCCRAHRREVFNLSEEFRSQYQQADVPGVPQWLNAISGISLEARLTISIWAILLSIGLALQIVVKVLWPASPTPTMLAVLSLLAGFTAWTRVSREFWEKKIGRWLSWLPVVGILSVAILIVILVLIMIQNKSE